MKACSSTALKIQTRRNVRGGGKLDELDVVGYNRCRVYMLAWFKEAEHYIHNFGKWDG